MLPPAELTMAFRAKGWKLTPQRQLLFKVLHDNQSHPTAEAIHAVASAQMPGISLRTVYQTLQELSLMGELQTFDFGDGPLRFDPNVGDHQHLLCRSCGRVADVYVDRSPLVPSEGLHGFSIESTDIVFRGRCSECAPSTINQP